MTRTRLVSVFGVLLGIAGCSEHELAPADPEVLSALDPDEFALPHLPPPRPLTAEGCSFLDPKATGFPVKAGAAFDAILYTLGLQEPDALVHWVQPAESPGPLPGWDFYVANAGGVLRWCYVDPRAAATDAAKCEGFDHPWMFIDGTVSGPPAVPAARAAAVLDHAVRIYEDYASVTLCSTAPEVIRMLIHPPDWHAEGLIRHVEWVEEVHPLPDLHQLIHVQAGGERFIRKELWSWDPSEGR